MKAGYVLNIGKIHLTYTQDFIGVHFGIDLGMVFLQQCRAIALEAYAQTFQVGVAMLEHQAFEGMDTEIRLNRQTYRPLDRFLVFWKSYISSITQLLHFNM